MLILHFGLLWQCQFALVVSYEVCSTSEVVRSLSGVGKSTCFRAPWYFLLRNQWNFKYHFVTCLYFHLFLWRLVQGNVSKSFDSVTGFISASLVYWHCEELCSHVLSMARAAGPGMGFSESSSLGRWQLLAGKVHMPFLNLNTSLMGLSLE